MYKVICGQSVDVSEKDNDSQKLNVLLKLIEKIDLKYIFNADETVLFIKCLLTRDQL